MRRLITCLVGFLWAVTSTHISRAEELPLWEAGLGVAGLTVPDYRGSDQQRFYELPLPYLVYRGDFLRLDNKGITGLLFHSERVRLNISADASVPVNSSQDTARRGCRTSIPWSKSDRQSRSASTETRIPSVWCSSVSRSVPPLPRIFPGGTRKVSLSIPADVDYNNIGRKGWNLGLAVGPLFATEPYHEYYYG